MKYYLILCFSLISALGNTQSISGIWESYDDQTGKLESEIEITIKNGTLYGKIIKLYNSDGSTRNPKCTKCTGRRKGQPIVGMVFISGLKQSGKYWLGDELMFNPNTGKSYDAKLWLEEPNKLAVRGYLGILYKTQYWIRVEE